MLAPSFIHLRLHSEYSIVDGIVRLDEAVEAAAKDGMPAVALTGFGRPEDVQRASDQGFYAHLTKPFDLQTLARLLQKIPRRNGVRS